MSARILHIADLHIGYTPSFLPPDKARARAEDFRSAFQRAADFALKPESSINAVIIGGDLFDCSTPDEATRGFVRAQLGRLSSASMPVLVVPGTHDTIAIPESVYRRESFPAGVHILAEPFSSVPLELLLNGEKFSFYWLTYEPGEKRTIGQFLREIKADLPPDAHKVFIAHASLMGSPEWDMRRKDLPVSLDDLFSSGMHYAALGHYHGFFESPQGQSSKGQTKVVYPGTLEGKAFGENGCRYLVVVNFDDNGIRVEKTPFNCRTLEEMTLSLDSEPVSSEEELLKRLESLRNKNLILKLTITGNPDFMIRAGFLAEALAGKFFHIEIEDATSALSSIPVEEFLHERTIRGMFVRKLKEAIEALPEADSLEARSSLRAVCELALKEGMSAFDEKGITASVKKE